MSKLEYISRPQSVAADQSVVDKQTLRLRLYSSLGIGDIISIILAFVAASAIPLVSADAEQGLMLGMAIVPIYLVFAFGNQSYSMTALLSTALSVRSAILSLSAAVLVVIAGFYAFQSIDNLSRGMIGFGYVFSAFFVLLSRSIVRDYVRRFHKDNLNSEIVIVDTPMGHSDVMGDNVVLARYVGIEPNLNDPLMLHRLGVILRNFDRAIVVAEPDRWASWAMLLKGANITGEIVMPDINGLRPLGVARYGVDHTLTVARGPLALTNRAKKRLLDIAITLPLLLFLTPLMLVVALAIKLDSPGSVFFKQQRIGRGNLMFNILKFRSMYDLQCDANGHASTGREDARVTRVGKFIRATSIDELPQLINVLIGDMSLVGPRPHALGSRAGDKLFWEVDPKYWHRHALKPGITGLAQVRGFRGATEQMSDLQNRLNSDLEYMQGWSIWRDMAILIGTGLVVVHKNAY